MSFENDLFQMIQVQTFNSIDTNISISHRRLLCPTKKTSNKIKFKLSKLRLIPLEYFPIWVAPVQFFLFLKSKNYVNYLVAKCNFYYKNHAHCWNVHSQHTNVECCNYIFRLQIRLFTDSLAQTVFLQANGDRREYNGKGNW